MKEICKGKGWMLNRGIKPVEDGIMIDVVYNCMVLATGVIAGLDYEFQPKDVHAVAIDWWLGSGDWGIFAWRLHH